MLLTRISNIRVNIMHFKHVNYIHVNIIFRKFALILLHINFVRVVKMLRYTLFLLIFVM